jgi:tetratricopeptide (TPR) repeat protein
MLMTLPFVLLLLDYWPLQRMNSSRKNFASGERAHSLTRLAVEKIPFLLLAVAAGMFTLIARRDADAIVSFDTIPLSARLGTAAAAYGWYIGHTLWPTNLAALYPHRGRDWEVTPAVVGLVILILLSLLALRQVRRRPWLFVGWFWFVGTLIPVIGLAQGGEQAWADRFCYWPHIGLFVAIIWGLREWIQRWGIPTWVCGSLAAITLSVFACLTWIQTGYWRDTPTLWTRATAITRDNDVAHLHLAQYYLKLGVPEKAELHFAESVRLQPDNGLYQTFLGAVQLSEGKVKEASIHLKDAVRLAPKVTFAWRNLGMAKMRLQQPEAAAACFRAELELEPESADALAALGWARWEAGSRLDAVESFQSGLRINPELGEAWHGIGIAHLTAGRLEEAKAALYKAVEFRPQLAMAYSDLGVVFGRHGDWSQAVSWHQRAGQVQRQGGIAMERATAPVPGPDTWPDVVTYACRLAYAYDHLNSRSEAMSAYSHASRADPDWPRKFTTKARHLATEANSNRRDPQTALELAAQATAASADPTPDTLDALAAAQAAVGQFTEAVETAKRALPKAEALQDKTLCDAIRDHLKCFEDKKPYIRACPDP